MCTYRKNPQVKYKIQPLNHWGSYVVMYGWAAQSKSTDRHSLEHAYITQLIRYSTACSSHRLPPTKLHVLITSVWTGNGLEMLFEAARNQVFAQLRLWRYKGVSQGGLPWSGQETWTLVGKPVGKLALGRWRSVLLPGGRPTNQPTNELHGAKSLSSQQFLGK
jgi:hypothetical protein